MVDNALEPKDRIVFPLDVKTYDEALRLAELLKDSVGVFKIGLELFVLCGPDIVTSVRQASKNKKIFLDLKFHDIPATVGGAMRSASTLGADFLTVHCEGGSALLKAVSEGAGSKTKVLGVTVLTSLSGADLIETGIDPKYADPADLVLKRALLAKSSGCSGIVCSGLEAKAVRGVVGADFLIVTPGIRSSSDEVGDQKRVASAYEAIRDGADYIVVGRPIRNAKDPIEAAQRIAKEVEEGFKARG